MSQSTTLSDWMAGARPRTLPAAVVPVSVGTAMAATVTSWSEVVWWRVAAALVVSLALQIGVNYANDYSDGIRGTDDVRVGPLRLVASGRASASAVRSAALLTLGCAAVVGVILAVTTSLWLLAVGAAALLAAWGYTGGPRPYGYLGLGEVFVFVFFGLVATAGTTYVAVGVMPWEVWVAGAGVGALACALLVVNNLRDIPTDAAVGKMTLAVRLGDTATRRFYVGLIAVAFGAVILVGVPLALITLGAVGVALDPVRRVLGGASGRDLIAVLGSTGRLQLAYGLLLTVGLGIAA
jgi:1,4-dihydroxy-2-naphthoate octaprenyltransferase